MEGNEDVLAKSFAHFMCTMTVKGFLADAFFSKFQCMKDVRKIKLKAL